MLGCSSVEVRVLGIETSSRQGSVALVENGETVAIHCHDQPAAHAEQLLPLLERAMEDAGWRPSDLDRVAVGVGPGSFTGLRIGVAFAQGIALGLAIPLVGVGSLRALAHAVPGHLAGPRLALLDARRAEVFAALYEPSGAELLAPVTWPLTAVPEAVRRLLANGPGVVVGDLELGAEILVLHALPSAREVATLALSAAVSEQAVTPAYVRDPGVARPKYPPDALAQAVASGTGISIEKPP